VVHSTQSLERQNIVPDAIRAEAVHEIAQEKEFEVAHENEFGNVHDGAMDSFICFDDVDIDNLIHEYPLVDDNPSDRVANLDLDVAENLISAHSPETLERPSNDPEEPLLLSVPNPETSELPLTDANFRLCARIAVSKILNYENLLYSGMVRIVFIIICFVKIPCANLKFH
jgi:hypothetical protein